mmetsp:Transcript_31812/g.70663  ORF Transcript_31812/g.70663 Transcript_31812/m.70663 type:complete len:414 (-) Transcript_31812:1201-2442(-)
MASNGRALRLSYRGLSYHSGLSYRRLLQCLEPFGVVVRVVVARDGPVGPVGVVGSQGGQGMGVVHELQHCTAQVHVCLAGGHTVLLEATIQVEDLQLGLRLSQLVEAGHVGDHGVAAVILHEVHRVIGPQHCQPAHEVVQALVLVTVVQVGVVLEGGHPLLQQVSHDGVVAHEGAGHDVLVHHHVDEQVLRNAQVLHQALVPGARAVIMLLLVLSAVQLACITTVAGGVAGGTTAEDSRRAKGVGGRQGRGRDHTPVDKQQHEDCGQTATQGMSSKADAGEGGGGDMLPDQGKQLIVQLQGCLINPPVNPDAKGWVLEDDRLKLEVDLPVLKGCGALDHKIADLGHRVICHKPLAWCSGCTPHQGGCLRACGACAAGWCRVSLQLLGLGDSCHRGDTMQEVLCPGGGGLMGME